jgi:peptide chain release factor
MGETFISPEKIRSLEERMKELGIEERDIEEKFIRSQGRGGQKVNKSSTCVYLKHVPTGIEVKCQKARTQAMNRFFARRLLTEKIDEHVHGKSSVTISKIDRIRKQKQRRIRRSRTKNDGNMDKQE